MMGDERETESSQRSSLQGQACFDPIQRHTKACRAMHCHAGRAVPESPLSRVCYTLLLPTSPSSAAFDGTRVMG